MEGEEAEGGTGEGGKVALSIVVQSMKDGPRTKNTKRFGLHAIAIYIVDVDDTSDT